MREMSKWNTLGDTENGVVAAGVKVNDKIFPAGPGHFGKDISGDDRYSGTPVFVTPSDACSPIENKKEIWGRFALATRGVCTFAQKVRNIQEAGATFAVILDNVKDSSYENTVLFAMSGDGKDDIEIPAVFLFYQEGAYLTEALKENPELIMTVGELKSMKYQFENSCDNGNCDPITNAQSIPADRESFVHLKKVLSQLVAQFELSLSNEEPIQSKSCSEDNLDLQVSKDKFVNEDRSVCTNCNDKDKENKLTDKYEYDKSKAGDI